MYLLKAGMERGPVSDILIVSVFSGRDVIQVWNFAPWSSFASPRILDLRIHSLATSVFGYMPRMQGILATHTLPASQSSIRLCACGSSLDDRTILFPRKFRHMKVLTVRIYAENAGGARSTLALALLSLDSVTSRTLRRSKRGQGPGWRHRDVIFSRHCLPQVARPLLKALCYVCHKFYQP